MGGFKSLFSSGTKNKKGKKQVEKLHFLPLLFGHKKTTFLRLRESFRGILFCRGKVFFNTKKGCFLPKHNQTKCLVKLSSSAQKSFETHRMFPRWINKFAQGFEIKKLHFVLKLILSNREFFFLNKNRFFNTETCSIKVNERNF